MEIKKTQLYFLKEDCIKKFGEVKGEKIFLLTEKNYKEFCNKRDYRGSKAIREHMLMNLFPTMAYYKTLREFGYNENEAIKLVKEETFKSALDKKKKQERLKKIPGTYSLYRALIKSVIRKKFPIKGWDTEWVSRNKEAIHFNFYRCLYKDICDEESCPELCKVFCENDDIAFSGLLPKIKFQRNKTLGNGYACCDFHFIRVRKNDN